MPATDITWAVDDLNARAESIRLRQAYYDGRHRRMIPGEKTLNRVLRDLLDNLSDNLCDDVVDERVRRIELTAWNTRGLPEEQGKAIAQAASESWEENRGDARLGKVERDSAACGDGWVIVQQNDAGAVRWYPQAPECMAARYCADEPDLMEVAAKAWRDGTRWRLNLYYGPESEAERPDGVPMGVPWVERYATKGTNNDGTVPGAKSFVAYATPDALPWEALDGDRMPVFHYPANEVGGYGSPAISRTILNLQDVLNKSFVDMVVAMEGRAEPDRWATGIQVEYDQVTGHEKPLKATGNERMIRVGSKDAAFGQFTQADLGDFHRTQSTVRLEIARKGFLPPSSVSDDVAAVPSSGLGLLVNEGRLVKAVLETERDHGVTLREQTAYVLRLQGMDVNPSDLEIEWAPAQTRDEVALLEALTLKVALGLPKREALIQAGEDPDDVDNWLDEAQAKADRISGGSGLPALPPAQGSQMPAPPMPPAGAAQPVPAGAA